MQKAQGFTLIELMITVAIIGILTAIAIPSYRDSVRKSNRADAQISLSRLATLEEKYFFRTNNYSADFADFIAGATSGAAIDSDEGHYSIAVSGGGTAWSMTATAQGNQAGDTDCATLTLNSLGAKTGASADCW